MNQEKKAAAKATVQTFTFKPTKEKALPNTKKAQKRKDFRRWWQWIYYRQNIVPTPPVLQSKTGTSVLL